MIQNNKLLKSIAVFVVITFLTQDVAMALPPQTTDYRPQTTDKKETPGAAEAHFRELGWFPKQWGSIEESFQGTSDRTVVLIQDAHDSLEAQMNIARMVDLLTKRGADTVFEEGYQGKVPTGEYFSEIQNKNSRKKVAYALLDRLEIGGAEFAHINRPEAGDTSLEWELIGADNQNDYFENLRAYRDAHEKQPATERDLVLIQKEFNALAKENFSSEAKAWLSEKQRFENGALPLLEYLNRLENKDQRLQIAGQYPALRALSLAAETPRTDSHALSGLTATQIFTELKAFEKEIAGQFFKTEKEKTIFESMETLGLLFKLNDLRISREELGYLQTKLGGFKTEPLAKFISRERHRPVVLSKKWEKAIQPALKFYEYAAKREDAVEQALQAWATAGAVLDAKQRGRTPVVSDSAASNEQRAAVLVFGGYHKEGLKEIFKKLGLSYVIITPRITEVSVKHQRLYREKMAAVSAGTVLDTQRRGLSPAVPVNARAARQPGLFLREPAAIRAEIRGLVEAADGTPNDLKTFSLLAKTRHGDSAVALPSVAAKRAGSRSEARAFNAQEWRDAAEKVLDARYFTVHQKELMEAWDFHAAAYFKKNPRAEELSGLIDFLRKKVSRSQARFVWLNAVLAAGTGAVIVLMEAARSHPGWQDLLFLHPALLLIAPAAFTAAFFTAKKMVRDRWMRREVLPLIRALDSHQTEILNTVSSEAVGAPYQSTRVIETAKRSETRALQGFSRWTARKIADEVQSAIRGGRPLKEDLAREIKGELFPQHFQNVLGNRDMDVFVRKFFPPEIKDEDPQIYADFDYLVEAKKQAGQSISFRLSAARKGELLIWTGDLSKAKRFDEPPSAGTLTGTGVFEAWIAENLIPFANRHGYHKIHFLQANYPRKNLEKIGFKPGSGMSATLDLARSETRSVWRETKQAFRNMMDKGWRVETGRAFFKKQMEAAAHLGGSDAKTAQELVRQLESDGLSRELVDYMDILGAHAAWAVLSKFNPIGAGSFALVIAGNFWAIPWIFLNGAVRAGLALIISGVRYPLILVLSLIPFAGNLAVLMQLRWTHPHLGSLLIKTLFFKAEMKMLERHGSPSEPHLPLLLGTAVFGLVWAIAFLLAPPPKESLDVVQNVLIAAGAGFVAGAAVYYFDKKSSGRSEMRNPTKAVTVEFEKQTYNLQSIKRMLNSREEFPLGVMLWSLLPGHERREALMYLSAERAKEARTYLETRSLFENPLTGMYPVKGDFTARFRSSVTIGLGESPRHSPVNLILMPHPEKQTVSFTLSYRISDDSPFQKVSGSFDLGTALIVGRGEKPNPEVVEEKKLLVPSPFLDAMRHFSVKVVLKREETWLAVTDYRSLNGTTVWAAVYPYSIALADDREELLSRYREQIEILLKPENMQANFHSGDDRYQQALDEVSRLYRATAIFPELDEERRHLIKEYYFSNIVGRAQNRRDWAMERVYHLLTDKTFLIWEPVLEIAAQYGKLFYKKDADHLLSILGLEKMKQAPAHVIRAFHKIALEIPAIDEAMENLPEVGDAGRTQRIPRLTESQMIRSSAADAEAAKTQTARIVFPSSSGKGFARRLDLPLQPSEGRTHPDAKNRSEMRAPLSAENPIHLFIDSILTQGKQAEINGRIHSVLGTRKELAGELLISRVEDWGRAWTAEPQRHKIVFGAPKKNGEQAYVYWFKSVLPALVPGKYELVVRAAPQGTENWVYSGDYGSNLVLDLTQPASFWHVRRLLKGDAQRSAEMETAKQIFLHDYAPDEVVAKIRAKFPEERNLRIEDLTREIDFEYVAKSLYKHVFRITLHKKQGAPILLAFKRIIPEQLGHVRGTSEVSDSELLDGQGTSPFLMKADYDDRFSYLEKFISGPASFSLYREGQLSLPQRKAIVKMLFEVARAMRGNVPRDFGTRSNIIFEEGSDKAVLIDVGDQRLNVLGRNAKTEDQILFLAGLAARYGYIDADSGSGNDFIFDGVLEMLGEDAGLRMLRAVDFKLRSYPSSELVEKMRRDAGHDIFWEIFYEKQDRGAEFFKTFTEQLHEYLSEYNSPLRGSGSVARKALKERLKNILYQKRKAPIVSIDMDDTFLAYGAPITEEALRIFVSYLEKGGHIAFNTLANKEWFYRRVVGALYARLHVLGKTSLLNQVHIIVDFGREIYVYDQTAGAYRQIYKAESSDKGQGLLKLTEYLKRKASLLAFYGDNFRDAWNDRATLGKPWIPIVVNVGDEVKGLPDTARQEYFVSKQKGPSATFQDFVWLTRNLSHAGILSLAAAGPVPGKAEIVLQAPEKVLEEAPGFAWAGTQNEKGEWDPNKIYWVPLLPSSSGEYVARLPRGSNVYNVFWTAGSAVAEGKSPGYWVGENRSLPDKKTTARSEIRAGLTKVNQILGKMEIPEPNELDTVTFDRIAKKVSGFQGRSVVFLGGPSAAGKTHLTNNLRNRLEPRQLKEISLDRYFKSRTEMVADGEQVLFDHPDSSHLKLAAEHIRALLKGEAVELPYFDMKTGVFELHPIDTENTKKTQTIKLEPGEILIVDSIHALRPEILEAAEKAEQLKVYVKAPGLVRLARRMARDVERGYTHFDTLKFWPYLMDLERQFISPSEAIADEVFENYRPEAQQISQSYLKQEIAASVAKGKKGYGTFLNAAESALIRINREEGPELKARRLRGKAQGLLNLTLAINVMDLGAEISDQGAILYKNNFSKLKEVLPLLRKMGIRKVYLYGLAAVSELSKEVHTRPDREKYFLTKGKATVLVSNYEGRRANYGKVKADDGHGNIFSIGDMKILNPQYSETPESAEQELLEITALARELGIAVTTDFISWRSPDAIDESNYRQTFYRELSDAQNQEFRGLAGEKEKQSWINQWVERSPSFFAVRITEDNEERVILVKQLCFFGGCSADQAILNPLHPEVRKYYIQTLKKLIDSGADQVRMDLAHMLLKQNLRGYFDEMRGRGVNLESWLQQSGIKMRKNESFENWFARQGDPWNEVVDTAKAYALSRGRRIRFTTETYDSAERQRLFALGINAGYDDIIFKTYEALARQREARADWLDEPVNHLLHDRPWAFAYLTNFDQISLVKIGGPMRAGAMLLAALSHLGAPSMVDLRDFMLHHGHFLKIVGGTANPDDLHTHPFPAAAEIRSRAGLLGTRHAIETAPWRTVLEDFLKIEPGEGERYIQILDNENRQRFFSLGWMNEAGDWIVTLLDFKGGEKGEVRVKLPPANDATLFNPADYEAVDAEGNQFEFARWNGQPGDNPEIVRIRFGERERNSEYKVIKLRRKAAAPKMPPPAVVPITRETMLSNPFPEGRLRQLEEILSKPKYEFLREDAMFFALMDEDSFVRGYAAEILSGQVSNFTYEAKPETVIKHLLNPLVSLEGMRPRIPGLESFDRGQAIRNKRHALLLALAHMHDKSGVNITKNHALILKEFKRALGESAAAINAKKIVQILNQEGAEFALGTEAPLNLAELINLTLARASRVETEAEIEGKDTFFRVTEAAQKLAGVAARSEMRTEKEALMTEMTEFRKTLEPLQGAPLFSEAARRLAERDNLAPSVLLVNLLLEEAQMFSAGQTISDSTLNSLLDAVEVAGNSTVYLPNGQGESRELADYIRDFYRRAQEIQVRSESRGIIIFENNFELWNQAIQKVLQRHFHPEYAHRAFDLWREHAHDLLLDARLELAEDVNEVLEAYEREKEVYRQTRKKLLMALTGFGTAMAAVIFFAHGLVRQFPVTAFFLIASTSVTVLYPAAKLMVWKALSREYDEIEKFLRANQVEIEKTYLEIRAAAESPEKDLRRSEARNERIYKENDHFAWTETGMRMILKALETEQVTRPTLVELYGEEFVQAMLVWAREKTDEKKSDEDAFQYAVQELRAGALLLTESNTAQASDTGWEGLAASFELTAEEAKDVFAQLNRNAQIIFEEVWGLNGRKADPRREKILQRLRDQLEGISFNAEQINKIMESAEIKFLNAWALKRIHLKSLPIQAKTKHLVHPRVNWVAPGLVERVFSLLPREVVTAKWFRRQGWNGLVERLVREYRSFETGAFYLREIVRSRLVQNPPAPAPIGIKATLDKMEAVSKTPRSEMRELGPKAQKNLEDIKAIVRHLKEKKEEPTVPNISDASKAVVGRHLSYYQILNVKAGLEWSLLQSIGVVKAHEFDNRGRAELLVQALQAVKASGIEKGKFTQEELAGKLVAEINRLAKGAAKIKADSLEQWLYQQAKRQSPPASVVQAQAWLAEYRKDNGMDMRVTDYLRSLQTAALLAVTEQVVYEAIKSSQSGWSHFKRRYPEFDFWKTVREILKERKVETVPAALLPKPAAALQPKKPAIKIIRAQATKVRARKPKAKIETPSTPFPEKTTESTVVVSPRALAQEPKIITIWINTDGDFQILRKVKDVAAGEGKIIVAKEALAGGSKFTLDVDLNQAEADGIKTAGDLILKAFGMTSDLYIRGEAQVARPLSNNSVIRLFAHRSEARAGGKIFINREELAAMPEESFDALVKMAAMRSETRLFVYGENSAAAALGILEVRERNLKFSNVRFVGNLPALAESEDAVFFSDQATPALPRGKGRKSFASIRTQADIAAGFWYAENGESVYVLREESGRLIAAQTALSFFAGILNDLVFASAA